LIRIEARKIIRDIQGKVAYPAVFFCKYDKQKCEDKIKRIKIAGFIFNFESFNINFDIFFLVTRENIVTFDNIICKFDNIIFGVKEISIKLDFISCNFDSFTFTPDDSTKMKGGKAQAF
jgi:hypothetical protein